MHRRPFTHQLARRKPPYRSSVTTDIEPAFTIVIIAVGERAPICTGSKAVRGDQMEVLENLGKSNQSGHRMPIRMSKTTGFPGRNAIFPKRGGWQGGSKMQDSRGKRGSKWSNPVHFERILVQIVRVRARLSAFSSNPMRKSGPKRPHGANIRQFDLLSTLPRVATPSRSSESVPTIACGRVLPGMESGASWLPAQWGGRLDRDRAFRQ